MSQRYIIYFILLYDCGPETELRHLHLLTYANWSKNCLCITKILTSKIEYLCMYRDENETTLMTVVSFLRETII